jgi:hypothetical protein
MLLGNEVNCDVYIERHGERTDRHRERDREREILKNGKIETQAKFEVSVKTVCHDIRLEIQAKLSCYHLEAMRPPRFLMGILFTKSKMTASHPLHFLRQTTGLVFDQTTEHYRPGNYKQN